MKLTYYTLPVALVLVFGISTMSVAQGLQLAQAPTQTLVVGENTANHYGSFTINLRTGNGNPNNIAGGSTQLDIEFGPDFLFAESNPDFSAISMSNGTTTASVSTGSINGNVLTITSSVNVTFGGNAFSINIPTNLFIVNPISSGNYNTIRAKRNDAGAWLAWQTATFDASNTQITAASVTPNASVQGRTSEYTVQFSTGSGGFLRGQNSTITLTFPSGILPVGNIPGVSINGSPAFASALSATVAEFDVPIDVRNSSLVSIIIPRSAGLNTPATSGNYTLMAQTSVETTQVESNPFNIATNEVLSFSSILLSDNTANANASYTIEFVVSNSGALSRAANDRIKFTLPPETFVPSSIPASAVDVENTTSGFSGNPSSVTVDGNTISFPTPIDIGNGNDVRVFVKTTAGILNPYASGNYVVSGVTTEDDSNQTIDIPANSNPYTIGAPSTTVSQAVVSITNPATPATTTYSIVVRLGDNGRLVQNVGTITLEFPAAYNSANLTNNASFTINGTPVAAKNVSGTEVVITTPITLSNNQEFTIVGTSISNPVAQTYSIGIKTSSEPTINQSETFTIGGALLGAGAITNVTQFVNRPSRFTVALSNVGTINGTGGAGGAGWVEVRFPEGTIVPETIANNQVTLNNAANISVTTNPTGRIVRVTRTAANALNNPTSIDILLAANVIQGSIPVNGLKVQVRSSSKPTWVTSTGSFNIASNTVAVTNVTPTATPQVATGDTVSFQITFNTGQYGRLVGGTANGSNKIYITFPAQVTNSAAYYSANAC